MNELSVCVDRMLGPGRRLVLEKSRMWGEPGVPHPEPILLGVGFLDGDEGLRAAVREAASEWSKHANVEFQYGGPVEECEIRISFKPRGAWSYLGQDCLGVARNQPTMGYGWFSSRTSQEEIRRVVLHEFGHALGCTHEHSHPEGGIPWNTAKVYQWYQDHMGWGREMVDDNVLFRYDRTLTVHGEFDPRSIMLYAIPAELTDGVYRTEPNQELSEKDKAFIAEMYPRARRD